MKEQPLAQTQPPEAPPLLFIGAFQHLQAGAELAVDAEQGIEDEKPVIAGDVGGGPDRIEDGEIGLGDEFEDTPRRPPGHTGRGERHPCAGQSGKQPASFNHAPHLPSPFGWDREDPPFGHIVGDPHPA